MKRTPRKLALSRTTVRILDTNQLSDAAGAAPTLKWCITRLAASCDLSGCACPFPTQLGCDPEF